MRTTLTLDDDLAEALERLQKARDVSFKSAVNEALRRGLSEMSAPKKDQAPFQTTSVSLGRARFANIDNIADILAVAETESFK
jgi:predicted transcriptional regulator